MPRLRIAGLAVLLALSSGPAVAQSFQRLASFQHAPDHPTGRLLQVTSGLFYGVSDQGGANGFGTVFAIYRQAAGGWGTATLHSFSGPDGGAPVRGLTLGPDGYLYGITTTGGAYQQGTVFKIGLFGGLTTLFSIPAGANGARQRPTARLIVRPDGRLWGTVCGDQSQGGTGTIFSTTTSGAVAIEYVFPDGTCPASLVHSPDGMLYGSAYSASSGTVFSLSPSDAVITVQSFQGQPQGDLILGSDGAVYGVFWLDVGIFGFTITNLFGVLPNGEFTLAITSTQALNGPPTEVSPGLFYGPTGIRDVYRVQINGTFAGEYSVVGTLDPAVTGRRPEQFVKDPSAPMLYGVAGPLEDPGSGLQVGHGTAYAMALDGAATPLSAFTTPGPLLPGGALIEIDGALYGTSCAGGPFERGTVYKFTFSGVSVLHTFGPDDGSCPTGIVEGSDGRIYGATRDGRIFAVSASGVFAILHTLPAGNPRKVADVMIAATDGNLWGLWDGFSGSIMYRLAPDGTLTTFPMPVELGSAGGGLTQVTDGSFRGFSHLVTATTGSRLFRATQTGSFTVDHTFAAGRFVAGPLLQASDGQLYGSLAATPTEALGSIFRASVAGTVTTVHQFTVQEGRSPISALTELASGALAGVTFGNALERIYGTAFSVTPGGMLTTLHRFSGADGKHPYAKLLRGSDGALYGTTTGGGPGGGGVIFRIQP